MRKLRLIILLLVIIQGCSETTDLNGIPTHIQELENVKVIADLEPSGSVSFTEDRMFGEIYLRLLPPQLGFGPEFAVDKKGYVYRADKGERTILVFNDEGDLVQKVGRGGRGPGEFQSIVAVNILNDQLYVYDSNLSRISIFSILNYELVHTLTINTNTWSDRVEARLMRPQTIIPLGGDMYLTSVIEEKNDGSFYQSYYKMNNEGQLVSNKIIETKNLDAHTGTTNQGHSASIKPPYFTKGEISITTDGFIVHMNTHEFLVTKYDVDGNYISTLYHPFRKVALEEEEVLNEYHPNMHPVFDNAQFPTTWPALESLLIDDANNIWISTIVENKEIRQWYILEESGEILASFSWPRDSDIKIVRNGKMYAEKTDAENGIKLVVGYDIDFSQ